jgi:nitrate/nitrite-specific signal transduction histidine kinase
VARDGRRAGHWGLQGMRERAEAFGAHLDVWSEHGAGTEVELSVPARVAYERALTRRWWLRVHTLGRRS